MFKIQIQINNLQAGEIVYMNETIRAFMSILLKEKTDRLSRWDSRIDRQSETGYEIKINVQVNFGKKLQINI